MFLLEGGTMKNNNLVDLILEYQKHKDDIHFNAIIKKLYYIMSKYLERIPENDKNEVKQELLIRIHNMASTVKINFYYIDSKYFTMANLKVLINNKFSKSIFEKTFNDNYIYQFVHKYGIDNFMEVFSSYKLLNKFIESFAYYNMNNKIYYLIKLKFKSAIAEYYKTKNIMKDTLPLSEFISKIDEYAYIAPIFSVTSKYDWSLIDTKDALFLSKCIKNNRLLTQVEIAEELNISQQAVSKRFKKIKEKYKK